MKEIIFCKKCNFPNTRPGIHFDKEGVCEACLYEQKKKEIDWVKRWEDLKEFVKNNPSKSEYDCVVAVSGGKDSHFITHVMKERLGLNCLLVCVSDNMKQTRAGEHNLQNLAKEFDSDLFIYKMKPETQKKIMRYTTEEYGKPLYVIDRLIYTVPIWIAIKFNIPIVVYGENVSVTRGLKDNRDIPEAWNQISNSVANDISIDEITRECHVSKQEIRMLLAPFGYQHVTTPIYLSYFVEWDAWKNYQFAKLRGFWDLNGIWDRWGGFMNYWQIDSYGYMVAFDFKHAKLGHSGITDCTCELIRAGHLDKEEGLKQVKRWEGVSLPEAVSDFCSFVGYTQNEYFTILNTIKERFQNAKK